ncbi:MAG: GNAT family N-acetyltransferase [Flavobacteriales bacterium]|nr:GNAT family N-acetyltransferase [Flavobacteriales bacterium]
MEYRVERIAPDLTRSLRHQVLWPHIERVENCVIDIDQREDAIHLGCYDGERLVSVGSLFRMSSPKLQHGFQYRLRAMATHPDYHGKHAGFALVSEAKSVLSKMGTEVLWCDARLRAVGFYEKLGFQQLDEIYEVPNIGPHKFMWFEFERA